MDKSSAVEQNVQPTSFCQYSLDVFWIGGIQFPCCNAVKPFKLGKSSFIDVGGNDRGTGLGESLSAGAPDALPGGSYQGGLALKAKFICHDIDPSF